VLKKRARELTAEELKCGRVDSLDIRQVATRMCQTMRVENGLGLAAPQVGLGLRLFVAAWCARSDEAVVVCNPVLKDLRDEVDSVEGCLSLPGVSVAVRRARSCTLLGQALDGAPVELPLVGQGAYIAQHEVDHLDGILITKKLGLAGRTLVHKQLRALEEDFDVCRRKRRS
jgi:peptide deformylase